MPSATPILDLVQDPPAPRSNWLALAICVAIGGAIGLVPNSLVELFPGLNPLLFVPYLYITVAIHELGHLAAGKLTGMPPGGLIIGGFVMMKSGDRWTFRFDRRRILGGGTAIPHPVKGKFDTAGFAWTVAAGPIASILSTFVFWIAFLKYGSGTWGWIGSFFWASAVGVLSLIPMSVGLHKSDAARLRMLLTQPNQARAWMAALAVHAQNANGIRPRDWDAELVEQMLADAPQGSEQVFPQLMGYCRLLDGPDEAAAPQYLERALAASARAGKTVRQSLFLEAARVSAYPRGNAAQARTWRDRALKLRKPECLANVDAAIAKCEGRSDDAIRDIAAARAYIVRKKLDSGVVRFSREKLDEMERDCLDARRTPVPIQSGSGANIVTRK